MAHLGAGEWSLVNKRRVKDGRIKGIKRQKGRGSGK